MVQQTSPPSRLRKDHLLVIGIVLLILGFFFFYWASRVNWDYVSGKKETVEIGYYALVGDFGFGNCYPYQIYTPNQSSAIEMQTNDFLTIQCPDIVPNEAVYIVLFDTVPSKATLLNYSTGLVSYTNHQNNVSIYPYLLIPENQNNHTATVSTIKTLHHYETPQWVYFGIGVVLCSLAMIPIFKSNSKPKPISTEGPSQAGRGLIENLNRHSN